MANITKRGDKYRAQIYVSGHREARTFRTQREAKAWAALRESEVRTRQELPPAGRYTLADALKRYTEEVSPTKRGQRWEIIRAESMLRDPAFPSVVMMSDLTTTHFADWRDTRLRQVQAGSVLREISFLSAVLECARIEWTWIDKNPIKDMRKPRMPDHREVIISPRQVRGMLTAMNYSPRRPIRTVAQSVAACFLAALRTGMRANELCTLTWDRVYEDHCFLPVTKTTKRTVPLTRKALRIIDKMRDYDPERVFGLNSRSLDANFRKYRARAGLQGFTFHDARHTAATLLARKIDVLDLCRMFGWTTTKHALVYYNPTASSIAALLNNPKKS